MSNKLKIVLPVGFIVILLSLGFYYFLGNNKDGKIDVDKIDYKWSKPQQEYKREDNIKHYYDSKKAKEFFEKRSDNKEFVFQGNEFEKNDKNGKIQFNFTYKSLHSVNIILRALDIETDLGKIKKDDVLYTVEEKVVTGSNGGGKFDYDLKYDGIIFVQIKDGVTGEILKQYTIHPNEENKKKLLEEKRKSELIGEIMKNSEDHYGEGGPVETDLDFDSIIERFKENKNNTN